MRRTPLAGGLAVGLALALAACGGSASKTKASTPAQAGLTGRGPITFATGKDLSGNLQKQVNAWNAAHPSEQARIIELPEDADSQRQQMLQNAQTKSDAYTILNLDVVWTDEFAANRWLAQIPKAQIDLSKMLPATVTTGQYRGNLYAVPSASDGGLLYYRKDLLTKAGITSPPTTWAQMFADCDKIKPLPEAGGASCYAGQFNKYEGLTVNFSEAVNGAGGAIVDAGGKPTVNTTQAKAGLDFLGEAFKKGYISKEALTYQEEESRRAFQAGKLIFQRQWPYEYALANKTDGSSKVAGKFAVAPLPGLTGPGVSSLGGHDLAISQFAKNKASALDFIKYMTSTDTQKANLLATSQAPVIASLYDDPELIAKFPYLPTLKASIQNAKARPLVVKYGDVTAAIQEAAYNVISGKETSDQALATLQTKLTTLVQP